MFRPKPCQGKVTDNPMKDLTTSPILPGPSPRTWQSTASDTRQERGVCLELGSLAARAAG